ncbi:hypothetical protein [Deinococcus pimensis]|uniref:hypothetical protein n=1 Tax=Deinococcus pimensis TaxID=309888 RepID=UPI0004813CF8|nr:hypothetical protein [Deinococcus pimensis]
MSTRARRHTRRLPRSLTVAALLALSAPTALAWKPVTHVGLADLALQDALDDGRVSFYETNFDTGGYKLDAAGHRILIGTYPVRPDLLDALRAYRANYHAGTFGPDAYPDIITGQMIIHPAGEQTAGESDNDINHGGPGTDKWLRHLYNAAFGADGASVTGATREKAFVTGFLTHAAEDMFAHTFVNHFTGDAYNYDRPGGELIPENAAKHVTLEGYLNKRGPQPQSWDASIDGLQGFITDNLVLARSGSELEQWNLLGGENTHYSIPGIFSRLFNRLNKEIQTYRDTVKAFDRQIQQKTVAAKKCKLTDFSCSAAVLYAEAAALNVEKAAYVALNYLPTEYKKNWVKDIRAGLDALPDMSHRLAVAMFFSAPQDGDRFSKADLTSAKEIVNEYAWKHLTSMRGLPDWVGLGVLQVQEIIDSVVEAIGIEGAKEALKAMAENLFDFLLETSLGLKAQELVEDLNFPEKKFDYFLNNPDYNRAGTGHLVSMRDFNRNELHLTDTGYENPDELYAVERVPAAYNSVEMVKLLLLGRSDVNALLRDALGRDPTETLTEPNVLLGYIATLDGKEQWHINDPNQMIFARKDNCAAYRRLFMRQTGATVCEPTTETPPPPAPSTVSATFTVPAGGVTFRTPYSLDVNYTTGETGGVYFKALLTPWPTTTVSNPVTPNSDTYTAAQGSGKVTFEVDGPAISPVDHITVVMYAADGRELTRTDVPGGFAVRTETLPGCTEDRSVTYREIDTYNWRVTNASGTVDLVVDSRDTALNLAALVNTFSTTCMIGKDNTRANPQDYRMQYFVGIDPGYRVPVFPNEDCDLYDPNVLTLTDLGANGWQLTAGSTLTHLFDTETDARRALSVARTFTRHCFFGRNDGRDGLLEYWR